MNKDEVVDFVCSSITQMTAIPCIPTSAKHWETENKETRKTLCPESPLENKINCSDVELQINQREEGLVDLLPKEEECSLGSGWQCPRCSPGFDAGYGDARSASWDC